MLHMWGCRWIVDVIYYESTLSCQPSSVAPCPPESSKSLCQPAVCLDCSLGMPGCLPAGECSLPTGWTCGTGTPSWHEWERVCVKVPQEPHEPGLKSSICSLLQSNIWDFIHMTKEQEEKEQTYLKIRYKED